MRSFLALLAIIALADGRHLTFIPPMDGPCPAGGQPGGVGLTTNPLGTPPVDTPYHVDIYLWTREARCVVSKCRSASTGIEIPSYARLFFYNVARISLSGLEPGTEYACEAADVVGDTSGPVFAFNFTTMPLPTPSPEPSPVPASPTPKPSPTPVQKPSKPVLRGVKTTKSGADVTTTKPARAKSFLSSCRVKGTGKKVPSSLSASKTALVARLKNLKPATAYACDIFGSNASGAGPALTVYFRTKK